MTQLFLTTLKLPASPTRGWLKCRRCELTNLGGWLQVLCRSTWNTWPQEVQYFIEHDCHMLPWVDDGHTWDSWNSVGIMRVCWCCYCWWKKSCTIWLIWNTVNNFTISTGDRRISSIKSSFSLSELEQIFGYFWLECLVTCWKLGLFVCLFAVSPPSSRARYRIWRNAQVVTLPRTNV